MRTDWKLVYDPQSSGQIEKMNPTLKETLAKLTLEEGSAWVSQLRFYRICNSPYTLGLTLFEIVYVKPPPILPNLKAELNLMTGSFSPPYKLSLRYSNNPGSS